MILERTKNKERLKFWFMMGFPDATYNEEEQLIEVKKK